MSWLFDRLCDLAAADRVEVVVNAALPAATADESIRLGDLLVRAARTRQFSLSIVHPGAARASDEQDIVIDIELLDSGDAEDAIAGLVPSSTSGGWFIRVEQGMVVVHEGSVDLVAPTVEESDAGVSTRRCVMTDRADCDEILDLLGALDLGITVGGTPRPGRHVVEGPTDLLVVLDALVLLRHVAFGIDGSQPAPDGLELVRRPLLRALLST